MKGSNQKSIQVIVAVSNKPKSSRNIKYVAVSTMIQSEVENIACELFPKGYYLQMGKLIIDENI